MQPGHVGQLPLMGPALRSSNDSRAQTLHGAAALRTANVALVGSYGTPSYIQLPGSYGYVARSPQWIRHVAPHTRILLLNNGWVAP